MSEPHNIYVHVPFCMAKCRYCAFWSMANPCPDWNAYQTKIISEINEWGDRLGADTVVPTVFFGGGTPSLMPVDVFGHIIQAIYQKFAISQDAEITIEANPGTLTKDKLMGFVASGVNRISIGVQSFDDEKLKFLGRIHDARTAWHAIEQAMSTGVRVSGDFIYGMPGDTPDTVRNLCREINNLGISHCSLYELTIEPNTPFGKMNLDMPSNNEMADMYTTISDTLKLPRYEVSNYAVAGNECRHNMNVWDGEPYIGIGRGGAGRPYINNVWYEQMGGRVQCTPMSDTERAIERIITGMRTVRGVRMDGAVQNIINMDWIRAHPDLVRVHDNRISATSAGMLILDDIVLNMTE